MKKIELGPHWVAFEPPDLLVVTFRGVVRAKQVVTYAEQRLSLLEGASYVLTLVDLRDAEGFEPESRKAIAGIRDPRPTATAFYGGSFAFRVIAEMVAQASRVLSKRNTIVSFFDDEPAARDWLAGMREQFKAS